MPDQTIASGATETIIPEEEAKDVADPESDVIAFIVNVSDNNIRLAVDEEREFSRSGFPVPAGATFTLDPKGNGMVAFGDGSGDSTVSVQRQKFVIAEVG